MHLWCVVSWSWCCVFGAMHCQLHRAGLLPQWHIYFITRLWSITLCYRGCNRYWNIRSSISGCNQNVINIEISDVEKYYGGAGAWEWHSWDCPMSNIWESQPPPRCSLSYLWQLALILHISQIYTNTLPPKCWRTRLNFASESLGGVLLQPLWSTLLGAVRSHHRSVKYKHNQKLLSMWLSVGMNVLLQKGLTCQSYTTIITRQSVHLVKLPNPQHKRNATGFHLPDPSNPGVVCVL